MKKKLLVIVLSGVLSVTQAQTVSVPHNFQANTPAKAEQVNANFNELVKLIKLQKQMLSSQQQKIAQLEAQLANKADKSALAAKADKSELNTKADKAELTPLQEKLTLVSYDKAKKTLLITGGNLQIINGAGKTDSANGYGNVIVGYSKPSTRTICSIGEKAGAPLLTQAACQNAGGNWAANQRSGSHGVVIGDHHDYTRYGFFVTGRMNTVNGNYASVSGGIQNTASSGGSAVSGGALNTANNEDSVVSGGSENTASGYRSVVSGGSVNTASGYYSVVSGGSKNTASSSLSVVSGGAFNKASGDNSVVSGGHVNTASDFYSVVSGGSHNTASGTSSVVSGGAGNTASGYRSVVSGGINKTANTDNQNLP